MNSIGLKCFLYQTDRFPEFKLTATYAAKAVGRLTGIPGIVLVTSGPGLTNTITAVQEASLDNTPMLVISEVFHV